MKYRQLGSTGIEVSEIGFGAWGIGGNVGGHVAYGHTDDNASRKALRRAFELGITFYDTAYFYGFGHSEKLIGETLKEVRSDIVIASKVGLVDKNGSRDFSPAHIRRSLEGSLKRLQTDYIDLYQLHSPSIDVLDEEGGEILSTLQDLREEGKIRVFGNSLNATEDGVPSIEKFGFDCIQVNFNMIDQRPLENGLFNLCKERNVGVIVRTPLCFGFLTGRYSSGGFAEFDHRSRWSAAQIQRWSEANLLFTDVFDKQDEQTPGQIALRYCLSFSIVSTIIPGMLTMEHVEENAAASQLGPLDDDVLQKIARIYAEHKFFVGK